MLLALEVVNPVFSLAFDDSGSAGKDAVSAMHQVLLTKSPLAFITSMSSASMALGPLAKTAAVPLIGVVVTTPQFAALNDWTFKYFPSAQEEVQAISAALKATHVQRLGVLYVGDDFGNSLFNELQRLALELQIEVRGESYLPSSTDFKDLLLKLKGQAPDGLYLSGFDTHLRAILTQLRQLQWQVAVFGNSTMSLPDFRTSMGQAANGVYIAAPSLYAYGPGSPQGEFIERYQKKYGRSPSYYAANGYDCIKLLAGLVKANSSPKSLREGLLQPKEFEGILGRVTRRQNNHELAFPLELARIEDSNLVFGLPSLPPP